MLIDSHQILFPYHRWYLIDAVNTKRRQAIWTRLSQFIPVYSSYSPSRVLVQDYYSGFLLPALNASFQLHHKNFGDGFYHMGGASHCDSLWVRDWLLCDASCALIGSAATPISGPSAASFMDHGGVGGGPVSILRRKWRFTRQPNVRRGVSSTPSSTTVNRTKLKSVFQNKSCYVAFTRWQRIVCELRKYMKMTNNTKLDKKHFLNVFHSDLPLKFTIKDTNL